MESLLEYLSKNPNSVKINSESDNDYDDVISTIDDRYMHLPKKVKYYPVNTSVYKNDIQAALCIPDSDIRELKNSIIQAEARSRKNWSKFLIIGHGQGFIIHSDEVLRLQRITANTALISLMKRLSKISGALFIDIRDHIVYAITDDPEYQDAKHTIGVEIKCN